MFSTHAKDNHDNCDICGKKVPYYMLTMVNGAAVCSHCLGQLTHEYEYYDNDEDFED